MLDLEKELNKSQLDAVTYCDGPQLVIAGAGSGKTRVLTYKIAHLMTIGYKPWNILALTFTNKAANEMKDRITNLVGPDARYLNMGTFHSVFARILRAEAQHIEPAAFNSQFTIYDESDSRSLLKAIIKDLSLDDKIYRPSNVHSLISWAKNRHETPHEYRNNDHYRLRDRDAKMDRMPEIYEIYQQRLQTSNAMDFDDLLLYTFLLFHKRKDIRQKYAQRFQYILVDEYQDTNAVQQLIVLQLSGEHRHICVVGDDAQSIYGFRGANIDNILDFQNKFASTSDSSSASDTAAACQPARLFKLEQNYRSTQRIVQAANSLITHNKRQIPKEVYSQNAEGDPLILKNAYSDREEAIIVCQDIEQYKSREHLRYSDFAILYRTNAQSRIFEEQLRKDAIPYRIYGGLSFYQRKEIKDVIAYFRLIVNTNDEEALRRIINYPKRGLGATTVDKVFQQAHALSLSPWDVIMQPEFSNLQVSKATITKLQKFAGEIARYVQQVSTVDAYTLGKQVIQEMGIQKDIYSGTDPDDISRQENLQELLSSLQDFVESRREEGETDVLLSSFLQEVSLMSDLDSDGKKIEDGANETVSLMTIHSAKGLEFPVVFIVGMEENIFPSPMSSDSPRKLEEERRLLYVAITRAERHCILTCAQSRYRYGHMEFDSPSRFLRDISSKYMRVSSAQASSAMTGRQRGSWDAGSRYQNSKPVASQFKADPKPMITQPRRQETAQSPFSESFKRQFAASGGSLRRLSEVTNSPQSASFTASSSSSLSTASGNRPAPSAASNNSQGGAFSAGDRIQHDRFGIGTIIAIEGNGENTKATVEFQHAGRKQLLLKFARITKI